MILRKGKGMKGKDLSSRREIEERREEKEKEEEEEDEKGCALLQSKGGWMVSTLSVLLSFSLSFSVVSRLRFRFCLLLSLFFPLSFPFSPFTGYNTLFPPFPVAKAIIQLRFLSFLHFPLRHRAHSQIKRVWKSASLALETALRSRSSRAFSFL